MTFAQLFRLIWIDTRLAAPGHINRQDIFRAFGVTHSTAAADFRAFMARWPGRMVYNAREKTYERGAVVSGLARETLEVVAMAAIHVDREMMQGAAARLASPRVDASIPAEGGADVHP